MKPTFATLCLLRLTHWLDHCHYCIRTALDARHKADTTNLEWWLSRARIHAHTARLHQRSYMDLQRLDHA